MVINRIAGRLHDEYIRTSDGFVNVYADFAVTKHGDFCITHAQSQPLRNFLRQIGICITGKNFNVFAMGYHGMYIPLSLFKAVSASFFLKVYVCFNI